ncbi:MAG TPA: hypothetical protein VHI51_07715, partial [Ktedonobacterales bacterium]|nr:hypothetical protein [Ktedonobacterales bacterium]
GVWLGDDGEASAGSASTDSADTTDSLSGLGADSQPSATDEPAAMALPTRIIEALRGRRAAGRDGRDGRGALARRGVLDDAIISPIKDAGYGVPRGMVALWIAAAADSPLLAGAIEAAQTALRSDGVEGWTLLALTNAYPLDPAEHLAQEQRCGAQPWEALLVGGPTTPPPVTFAYLFETHDERGLFWEGPDETSFAAAEAIFTLTGSGLTVTREYEEMLRRNMPRMISTPQERFSSVATSRLTFPRAQAERYCAYQLGASILREWTPEQAADLPRDDEREQGDIARATFQRILDDTASSNALVAALRRSAQRRSRRRAREDELPQDRSDSKLILRLLSPNTVRQLITRQLDLPAALEGQRQLAEEGFGQWEEALVPAWSRYADEAAKGVAAHADDLTLEGGALGVERAYAYMFAFHEALRDEQDRLDAQRARRVAARARYLSELEARSEGPWLPPSPEQQAPDGAASETSEEERETRLAERLGARWRWLRARRPTPPTLIAAATLAAATLALLALVIAPAAWRNASVGWLALVAIPALVAGLAAWGFARYRQKVEDEAAYDLHDHYRAIYRYRIQKREAEWRETVLAMLRARSEFILARLSDWEGFISEMARALDADADAEEARLFDGAFGRRDVLVANRRRLRRDGYGLRDFELDVSKRRQTQPLPETPWHASNREMLARLRDALHGRVSLVEAPAEAIAEPVRDYCLGIVRPYLTGDLVNLTEALETLATSDGSSLLDSLIERAVLLYKPADQPRPATTFVAAREPDLEPLMRGKPLTGLIPLSMFEREWLAVARLLPGGARPDFLRNRAEATQAPIQVAPKWTQRLDPYPDEASSQSSQNGGVLN